MIIKKSIIVNKIIMILKDNYGLTFKMLMDNLEKKSCFANKYCHLQSFYNFIKTNMILGFLLIKSSTKMFTSTNSNYLMFSRHLCIMPKCIEF